MLNKTSLKTFKSLKVIALMGVSLWAITPAATEPVHGISVRGVPCYAQGFKAFSPYNPHAPKGGKIRVPVIGTLFDSLNPFLPKGLCARGLGLYEYFIFDTLMWRSPDEPFALYARLAEKVDLSPLRDRITFYLNSRARFHTGDPVKASDVVFTFKVLAEHGTPARKMLSKKIKSVTSGKAVLQGKTYETVTFTFNPTPEGPYDQELPLIMAGMPVLSEKSLKGKDFSKTGLEPLMGSGPYRITEVKPGQRIVYTRDPTYWGWNLPVIQGTYNFDEITFEYFGSNPVAFEAFKKGEVDSWSETDPLRWENGYNFPAVTEQKITREVMHFSNASSVTSLVFNTHHPFLKDPDVREALGSLFDFEWINAKLMHGTLTKSDSFFGNMPFAAEGLPSEKEKEILRQLPEMAQAVWGPLPEWKAPERLGDMRASIQKAHELLKKAGWKFEKLKKAGWEFEKRVWRNTKGQTLALEILLSNPQFEKIALAYQRILKKAGISLIIRCVDTAQYQVRTDKREFDLIVHIFGTTLSPGGEQKLYWLSDFAHIPSRNYAGIESKAIDKVCDMLAQAKDHESVVTLMKVLDRLLRHGFYMRPLYNRSSDRVAYWNTITHPKLEGKVLLPLESWWSTQLDASIPSPKVELSQARSRE